MNLILHTSFFPDKSRFRETLKKNFNEKLALCVCERETHTHTHTEREKERERERERERETTFIT